ncbi:uncharacterized protein [Antedon mediterranea]|uniref:uncharacterized protein isoform X3 n=1 Tax=Antedon mediterranea TaxID=105859 RepID=UPI003AF49960
MYNGIGLTTARGSGTNGFVTRNFAVVRNHKDKVNYKTEDELKQMDALMNRKGNIEILNHEKKRKVELKCVEMKEIMQEQGCTEEEIEQKVNAFRKLLIAKEGVTENDDSNNRSQIMETHQLAEAKEKQNAKLREAFGIGDNYVDGSSFDPDRRAKEAAAKEKQKNYEILEEPDYEEEEKTSSKRKKKKSHSHSRSESESPVRKERKKSHKRKKDRIESSTHNSKPHKSHRSKKHRSHRRKHHRNDDESESAADSAHEVDHTSDHQKSQSSKRSRRKEHHDYNKSDERRRKHKSRSPVSDYSSESSRSHSRSHTPRKKHRSRGHSDSPSRRSKSRSFSRSRSNSPTYRRSRSYSQDKEKRRHSRSNSKENGKQWSPIRKRRDSPSFLDARRITSARKRPIPYSRPVTSPSGSDSSYYSYTSRSRSSRTPSLTRYSRSWSRDSTHRH